MTETILIVDDSTFIVEGLVALLKKNYNPVPTFGGDECLNALQTITPSLIILDIMMEPMDGWETLARIKENPRTRHIPVLMFSAKKISPEEAETHRIIIDDFITKPVNPKKLIEAIEKVLARQEFNRQVLHTWESAGVSPAIIDEYLTDKMNLDVDISLLAVMKKQLELSYTGAVNRGDVEQLIATIESRIETSRARIESFCRDQAGTLPALESCGRSAPPPRGGDVLVPAPAAQPAVPEPVSQIPPVKPKAARTEPVIPVITPGDPEPSPIQPVTHTGPVTPAPLHEVPAEYEQKAPAMPAWPALTPQNHAIPPRPEHEPEPALPAALAGSGSQEPPKDGPLILAPAFPQEDTIRVPVRSDETKPLFEPFLQSPQKPPILQPEPRATESGDADERNLQTRPVPTSPGSGTQTPRMRSLAATNRMERREKNDDDEKQKPHPESSGGFFARVIAAISALFGRKSR